MAASNTSTWSAWKAKSASERFSAQRKHARNASTTKQIRNMKMLMRLMPCMNRKFTSFLDLPKSVAGFK